MVITAPYSNKEKILTTFYGSIGSVPSNNRAIIKIKEAKRLALTAMRNIILSPTMSFQAFHKKRTRSPVHIP